MVCTKGVHDLAEKGKEIDALKSIETQHKQQIKDLEVKYKAANQSIMSLEHTVNEAEKQNEA
jgi:hypothetical protein